MCTLCQNIDISYRTNSESDIILVSERACAHCAKSGDGDACGYWGGGQDADDGDNDDIFWSKENILKIFLKRSNWSDSTSPPLYFMF